MISNCEMSTELRLCKVKTVLEVDGGLVAQCKCTYIPLNCTFRNSQDDKFSISYILPQFKNSLKISYKIYF